MWRTVYKLCKAFVDQLGPKRIATSVLRKIDAFKLNLPILHCICNPGIRPRHWVQVRCKMYIYYYTTVTKVHLVLNCYKLMWQFKFGNAWYRAILGLGGSIIFYFSKVVRWLKYFENHWLQPHLYPVTYNVLCCTFYHPLPFVELCVMLFIFYGKYIKWL